MGFDLEEFHYKVFKNTLWNIFGKIWYFCVMLFVPFYLLSKIGPNDYGIYIVIKVVVDYMNLLDLGVSTSFVRYLSRFYSLNDKAKFNSYIFTCMIFYSVILLISMLILLLIRGKIAVFLDISNNDFSQFISLSVFYCFVSGFLRIFGVVNSIFSSIQRMDYSNKIAFFVSIAEVSGMVFFIESGFGLKGLILNTLLAGVINFAVNFYFSYKHVPIFSVRHFKFDMDILKNAVSYGGKLNVTLISSLIASHFEKIILTKFLSLNYVTFYHIASSLAINVRNIIVVFSSALMPGFSELESIGLLENLKRLYLKATKYMIIISGFIFGYLFVFSEDIVSLWLGKNFLEISYILKIIIIGYFINTFLGSVSSLVGQSIDRTDIQMKGAILNGILNMSLSYFFIIKFGFKGVAYGTSISLIVAAVYYVFAINKVIKVSNSDFWNGFLSVFYGIFFSLFSIYILKLSLVKHFSLQILYLIVTLFAFIIVYVGFMRLFKGIDNYDKQKFEILFRRFIGL